MALSQLEQFAKGIKDVKPVSQNFYVSTSPGYGEIPQVLSGEVYGMKKLTPEQAKQEFQKFVPLDGSKQANANASLYQSRFKGIKEGESVFDWINRTKPNYSDPNFADFGQVTELLQDPKAPSKNYVYLNGTLFDANKAKEITNMTPEQLVKMAESEKKTLSKMQGEQATEAARQADIKSYQDAGKPVPQELLVPGQGPDNGKDGFQVGSNMEQTQPGLSDFTSKDPVVIQKLKDMGAITADNAAYTAKPTSSKMIGGIDVSGFSADQQKALEDLYNNTKTDVSAVSNPVPLSNEKILEKLLQPSTTDFLGQAKGEYAPYYTQQKEQYAKDFEEALKFETEQRKQAQVQEQLEKQIALENQAAQSAEGGLAFSGIRQKAEQRIKDQAQNIATSSRRAFEYQSGARGRQAEGVLGSEYLKGLTLPAIGGASVFTPQGGVTGSLQREQMTAEQVRSAELAKQERLRNVAAIPGIDQKSLLSLASNF